MKGDSADVAARSCTRRAAAIDGGERIAVDAPPHPSADLPRGAWADLLAAAAVHTLARGRSAVLVVPDYRDQAQLLAALTELVTPDAIVRDDSDQSGPALPASRSTTSGAPAG